MIVFRFNRVAGRFEIAGVSGDDASPKGYFKPPVDISWLAGSFIIKFDLPGVRAEDVRIEAGENEIKVSGVLAHNDAPGPCRLIERPSGTFLRTISFPGRIDPEKITAGLENGVLRITVKSSDARRDPTRIEIQYGGGD